MNTFTTDLPFYLDYALRQGGEVLELCCGTGRLTIPMAKAGVKITGLDFTPTMLARAKEKAQAAGLNIPFIQGDMRTKRLRKKFKMIFIPFNSLLNTYTIEDTEKVFATVRRHLAPGGPFLFDVFNPSIHFIVDAGRKSVRGKFRFQLPDGRKVVIDESCHYDPAFQINRATWTSHLDGKTYRQKLDMRCIYPLELEALLRYNGFKVVDRFGDFTKRKFTSASRKQIYVCK
ncbi:MAG: hypothetical protein A2428_02595 [Bdellovibrionales bacterium RIFOXYC1_FULL_54_43]|nr:MAG: hypothetical protein A2428_02595 [Bdellovibrionales bacterium RIFOXYC1_FULL_54_43]OFZ82575.1 MAG: hypothetical protein A2603_15050 [Bdellovibrionales bacterium RIFOXYD1_FULL_55_31]